MKKLDGGTISIDRAEAMWLFEVLDEAIGEVIIAAGPSGGEGLHTDLVNARNALDAIMGEHSDVTIPGVGRICPECNGNRYEGDPGARIAVPCWRCDAAGRVHD